MHDVQHSLPAGAWDYLQPRASLLAETFSKPGERWVATEIDDAAIPWLQRLEQLHVIKVVDSVDGVNIYQTTQDGWDKIQELADQQNGDLLCDHEGLRNLGDGRFTCGKDWCSHLYSRDTAELLIHGDADGTDGLLCGHDDVIFLGDDTYTCTRDSCDHLYTKDTVEKLLRVKRLV